MPFIFSVGNINQAVLLNQVNPSFQLKLNSFNREDKCIALGNSPLFCRNGKGIFIITVNSLYFVKPDILQFYFKI